MKRFIISIIAILFVIAPNKAGATIPGYTVIAKSDKDNITIYAKKMDGLYYDFKIDLKGRVFSRPFWMNVTNPTYAPQIYYEDINKDEKKELIIILTKGYGTGVLDQEVNVFHIDYNRFGEVLVDNPLAIVLKNVKTRLTPTEAKISIGDKHYVVDISPVGIEPENIFNDISFGSIIKYEVENNQLNVRLASQVSPAHSIGEVIIAYEYRDKMYQAKSIEFQQYQSN
ncbi:hypothetical protein SAMN05444673_4099 [Bacillus sp. OV166]|uniref:hypothetical protein n=1 Tax=Bacillus sp. OV166 TaxID=1882763 RepID=UPI000A2ABA27|nr:hypothetical protein [Bacillus sp. OV166]SMQ81030.1 hypothetical protein SAMN05444673_4099 [Bacillus sp. OV166]